MPLYEYLCTVCGQRFERLVCSNSTSEVTCPKCSSAEVRKLISAFGIGGGSSKLKASSSGSGCSCCSSKNCSTCK